MTIVAGYDVGGAHLKIARVENGQLQAARQIACPLWQGIAHLDAALAAAAGMTGGADVHAITMTAELTEIFTSREQGVIALIDRLRQTIDGEVRIFAGLKGLVGADAARADPASVASANFLATARVVAAHRPRALLIDIGSTTTDIIACDRPQGLTDAERLQTGELVYVGLTRTPVPSVATRAPLAGQWQELARDAFATMADVHRILDTLPADVDLHATSDGRGKTLAESLARFARGFGRDAEMRHLPTWQASAAYVAERQYRAIHDGALQVLSRPGTTVDAIVAAGIGARAVHRFAARLDLPVANFGSLIGATGELGEAATRYAPAVSVALLDAMGAPA